MSQYDENHENADRPAGDEHPRDEQPGYEQHGYERASAPPPGQPSYPDAETDHTREQPTESWGLAGAYAPPPFPGGPHDQRKQKQRSRVPAWLWPVVCVLALVVGLIGGVVGGLALDTWQDRNSEAGRVSDGLDGVDTVSEPPLDPEDGSVAAVAQQLLPSTVQVVSGSGGEQTQGQGQGSATGSGFVLDEQGHIVTNNHVVASAAESGATIEVVTHRGRRVEASVVGRSQVYDLAVLSVEQGADELKPASLGSSRNLAVGQEVVAIGSPLGLSSTVTSGIVSALDRPVTTGGQDESSFINAVQTDAAINPGNSGGPLVDLQGQVVGVNSAIATAGGFGGGSGNIGVGFAIPVEQVKVTADQILREGEAYYPVIGAEVRTGGQQDFVGARIVNVMSGTPAEEAGLEEGDVVTRVGEKQITDGIGLIVAIRTHQPDDTVEFTLQRDGEEQTLDITLGGEVG